MRNKMEFNLENIIYENKRKFGENKYNMFLSEKTSMEKKFTPKPETVPELPRYSEIKMPNTCGYSEKVL
jgi:hypothetical protein